LPFGQRGRKARGRNPHHLPCVMPEKRNRIHVRKILVAEAVKIRAGG